MATVLLIRHGRTQANAAGVLAGRTPGVGLDELGQAQARAMGERLRATPLTALVHSPLERCRDTADLLLRGRGDSTPTHEDPRLSECDYGAWTGCRLEDLARDPLWSTVMERPSLMTFPGGESMAGMATRAVDSVADWCSRFTDDATIAVVSHGDVIKAILSDALAQDLDDFQRIAVSPGSLSVVRYGHPRPLVLLMNDTGGELGSSGAAPAQSVGGSTA